MVNMPWQIIYIDNEKQWSQNRSLWNSLLNCFPCRGVIMNVINTNVNSLFPAVQIGLKPTNAYFINPIIFLAFLSIYHNLLNQKPLQDCKKFQQLVVYYSKPGVSH